MNFYAKLTQYKAYRKSPTVHNRINLEGQIYELYCYNYILKNFKTIHIIKSKATEYERYNGFYYSKNGGKLFYSSCGIDLAEFDVIGIFGNELHYWEISKATALVARRNEKKV
jgi:hypothetical protein